MHGKERHKPTTKKVLLNDAFSSPMRTSVSPSFPTHVTVPSAQASVSSPAHAPEMDANTLKAQGNAAFKEGRFCLAVRRYTQGLAACCSRSPQEGAPAGHADRALRAALYTNRAACYLALQYPEPAFEDCNSALRLDPNNVKALFRKAQGLMAFEDPTALGRPLQHLQEALEAATAAAVLAPQDSAVQRVLKEAQAACAASTAPPLLDVRTSVQVNRGTNSSAASAVLIPQVLCCVVHIGDWGVSSLCSGEGQHARVPYLTGRRGNAFSAAPAARNLGRTGKLYFFAHVC